MSSADKFADPPAPALRKPRPRSPHRSAAARARLRRRQLSERLFRAAGQVAIAIGLGFVVLLFGSIIYQGKDAFTQTHLRLDVTFDPSALGVSASPSESELGQADYAALVRNALTARFPDVSERKERRDLASLVSTGAPFTLSDLLESDRSLLGQTRSL